MLNNKRGQGSVFNIYTFIIVAFIAALFFGGLVYVMGLINNVFTDVGIQNEQSYAPNTTWVNMTVAAQQTFGQVNNAIQALRMVAVVYILGLGIVIVITNAMMKMHPIFFMAYVLLVILGVIFAAPLSNAYYDLLTSGIFDGTLATFTATNFLVLHLPIIVAVIGILGGIFLFINLIRSEGRLDFQ